MGPPLKIDENAFSVLKGKTVLITGASSGIGLECADYFYKFGANVAYVGGRKRPPTEVPLDSPRTLLRNVDVSSFEQVDGAFQAVIEKFGRVDIVVANAGVAEPQGQMFNLQKDAAGKLQPPDLRVIDIDLKGTVYTVALGIHYMTQGGSIIMMTSLAGFGGVQQMPNYSGSKHAATGLLRSLTEPCRAKDIALSVVAPHITYTPGTFPDQYKPGAAAFKQIYDALLPKGMRISQAITCAQATAYLAAGGLDVAGQALVIEADEINEIEKDLVDTRPDWFAAKMSSRHAASKAYVAGKPAS
ncbi:MAG: hypothetical protein M1818_006566 [Claussenomyces sp. TS43310]|nr:MAG: hypothetical protein M1818_006566 [Claussenomyces sp. TS43310]